MPWLPIYPPQASSISGEVDSLALLMFVMSVLIAITIFILIVVFCVKYRRRPGYEIGQPDHHTTAVEVTWTIVPLALCMIPFVWGARIYFEEAQPPADAIEVYVVAKQWMWKTELPGGQEEINTLHVPTGRAVKLTLTSQDVIHSFYVPAFRVKADVLPGRYTTAWFTATRPGEYMLYCAQYCGTDHAAMTGHMVAMAPGDYANWLNTGSTGFQSPAAQGRKLFQQYGCVDCHEANRAPVTPGPLRPTGTALGRLHGHCGRKLYSPETYHSLCNDSSRLSADYAVIRRATQRRRHSEFDGLYQVDWTISRIERPLTATGPSSSKRRSAIPEPLSQCQHNATGRCTAVSVIAVPLGRRTYLNVDYALRSWLLTTDHKRIAILYLISITLMFFVGGGAATVMRLNLLTPNSVLVDGETYNKLFTMHGVVMVWFFLIPSIPAVLGNFLVPLMIGARDLAFPRLNLLSWYIYIVGALFTLGALLMGGVDTGWTFYTPFSTSASTTNVIATAVGIFIVGFSSILTGLNFIVSIHRLRAPGLSWFRLPLFLWSTYATSVILILATPVLGTTLILVAAERILRIGFFDPGLGGDPLLFQNMFWFYSHPAVYIMILPGMGVVSEIIAAFAHKPIFGYGFVAMASVAIAVLGFLV